MHEWLDRISEPVTVSDYISHRNANPAHFAKNPCAVIATERRLREMASTRPQRLLLHREASPLSRGALKRRLLRSADFAVYDFDDALEWDWGEGSLVRRLAPKPPKALTAMEHAGRVIAGSPVLADWASEHSRDVVLIPSSSWSSLPACSTPSSLDAGLRCQQQSPPTGDRGLAGVQGRRPDRHHL